MGNRHIGCPAELVRQNRKADEHTDEEDHHGSLHSIHALSRLVDPLRKIII